MRFLHVLALQLMVFLAIPCTASTLGLGHLTLGAVEDDEGMVLHPRQVEEGPDGNLYVLDGGDAHIKVYSPTGEFLRQLAGEGEGPGLFQRIDGATFGFMPNDRLYFTEFIRGHRWITTMELDGDQIRVISPQLEVGFGVETAAPLADGSFLVQLIYGSSTRAHKDYYLYDMPQALVCMDSTGVILSEIKRTAHTKLISFSPNGGTSNLPFTPSFAWCVLGDGRVAWSDGLSPVLQVIDHAGSVVDGIEAPLPEPKAVTRQEIQVWQKQRKELMTSRNPAWWQQFGRVVEAYDQSLYDKPILSHISRTPAGNILVESTWNFDKDGARYWLLDSNGSLLVEITAGGWRLHLSEQFALYFSNDEDGATLVHAQPRNVDEVAALEQIASFWDDE